MPYRAVMAQRLRFLEIDESTVASLGRLKQSLEVEVDRLLDRFYDHLLRQPELRAMFSDKETMARAREAQKRSWLTHLFAKHFNAAQFEQAEKIAQAHLRIGLEPSWYMSGYCYMLNQFVELACASHKNDTVNTAATIQAVNKLVFLDMNTVIDMYLEAKNATMRYVLRRRGRRGFPIKEVQDRGPLEHDSSSASAGPRGEEPRGAGATPVQQSRGRSRVIVQGRHAEDPCRHGRVLSAT